VFHFSDLVFDSTTTSFLGSLDACSVGLDFIGSTLSSKASHQSTTSLPWSLEIAAGGLAEDVNLAEVAFKSTLEGDDALHEKWVGVFEVEVHHAHHANTHELGFEGSFELR